MVARRPLVSISGQTTELPPGDSIVGGSVGVLVAGSGLNGGGSLSDPVTVNVSLAPNPSGLLFVNGKLGVDGAALVTGTDALSSGNLALTTGSTALASGVAGSTLAATALASGNAALAGISTVPGGVFQSFTAASAIASGYAVGLDNSGKVQSIRLITDSNNLTAGSPSTYESAQVLYNSVVFDSTNNKIVVTYSDVGNSTYGTSVVGAISGTSISFGTPVVFQSAACYYNNSTFDSTNSKVIVTYRDSANSDYGLAKVGTVSGTSISFGNAEIFEYAVANFTSAVYAVASNKIVVSYQNGIYNEGRAAVGTVSGTFIPFGTYVIFEPIYADSISSTYDTLNNKVIIAYRGVSDYGYAIVGTVSGNSITFGTKVVFASVNSTSISTTFDSISNKVVISYRNNPNSGYGTAVIGTVSGTSISFGTPVVFSSNETTATAITYNPDTNRVVISYANFANSNYLTVITGVVSGSSITFGSPTVAVAVGSSWLYNTYDTTSDQVVAVYRDGSTNFGRALTLSSTITVQPTLSSQNNFVGIAQSTVASGSAVNVRLPGSYDQNNTGLTPGAVYYVNPTTSGFTTTTTQPSAWSGAVNWGAVGRAVNSTTLLLTDMI